MDEADLRILAAERAIVELSAVVDPAKRSVVVESLMDELVIATGDERLVLQSALDLIQDGKMLADFLALGGWLRG